MQKYITEFLGTFLFVSVIALVAVTGSPLTPLIIGLGLMAAIYFGGHVSGAHYNPAVSFCLLIRKQMPAADLIPYWIAQIAGGLVAFAFGFYVSGKTPGIGPTVDPIKALLIEAFFTFGLCLVIMNIATSKQTKGNPMYGVAIGLFITAAAAAGGGLSGGAYNPAVGIAATTTKALFEGGSWANIWLYLVGPFAGALLAAFVYPIQNPEGND